MNNLLGCNLLWGRNYLPDNRIAANGTTRATIIIGDKIESQTFCELVRGSNFKGAIEDNFEGNIAARACLSLSIKSAKVGPFVTCLTG